METTLKIIISFGKRTSHVQRNKKTQIDQRDKTMIQCFKYKNKIKEKIKYKIHATCEINQIFSIDKVQMKRYTNYLRTYLNI